MFSHGENAGLRPIRTRVRAGTGVAQGQGWTSAPAGGVAAAGIELSDVSLNA